LAPGLLAVAVVLAKVREIAPSVQADPHAPNRGILKRLPGRFYAFVAIVTIFALGNSSDMFLVFLGKVSFGLGLAQLVGLWVALHVSKIVFSIPAGALSDRLGRRPLIIAGWLVYALVYLGFALARSVWQFWALIAAYGLYYGMTEGAEKALVADFVPSAYRGTAYGVYHAAVGLAALPASLAFGAIWMRFGPALPFGIGAGLAALAALLLAVLVSCSKRPEHGRRAATETPTQKLTFER